MEDKTEMCVLQYVYNPESLDAMSSHRMLTVAGELFQQKINHPVFRHSLVYSATCLIDLTNKTVE